MNNVHIINSVGMSRNSNHQSQRAVIISHIFLSYQVSVYLYFVGIHWKMVIPGKSSHQKHKYEKEANPYSVCICVCNIIN